MTFFSRVFGLLRDVTLANLFGASGGTDAFFVAFKIPNFMRRLFAEGAFSQAFVPVFSEYKEKKSPEALRDLINHVAGTLGLMLFFIASMGAAAAPALVLIFAPGFLLEDAGRFQLTADMLRITFPYIFFISLTAFAGGILNSYNRFAIPAFTPVLLNISLIAAAILFSPYFDQPLMALAWGVAVAGILQLSLQIPFLLKLGLFPRPKIKRKHSGVTQIMKLMIPAIIGSSVAQINLILDTIIASFLVAGSVSWLYYSDRLLEFPLGIFGIAIATVLLPTLSQQHVNNSPEKFNKTLDWGLKLAILIATPACIGLFMIAGPVLASLFQYGEFTSTDTHLSSLSLMAYMLGLPAFILIKILVPGFYSRQDTKTPVKIAVIALITNMILNIAFVVPMVKMNYEAPHVGLALATTIAAYLNAFLLYRALRKSNHYTPLSGWNRFIIQICIASIMMCCLLYLTTPESLVWNFWTAFERILALGWIILASAVSYFSILWLTGMRLIDLKKS